MSANRSSEPHKPRRWAIAGLVILHAVALALGVLIIRDDRFGIPIEPLFGLGIAQATLLAVWLALGQGRWIWRLFAVVCDFVLATLAIALAANGSIGSEESLLVAILFIAPAAMVCAVLLAARRLGLVLGTVANPGAANDARLRRQFGTRDLFLVTLLVALLLGAIQAVRRPLQFSEIDLLLVLMLESAGATLALLWLVLGQSPLRWRLLAIPVAGLCIGCSYFVTHNWEPVKLLGPQAVVQVLTLLALRACGIRLTSSDRSADSVELL